MTLRFQNQGQRAVTQQAAQTAIWAPAVHAACAHLTVYIDGVYFVPYSNVEVDAAVNSPVSFVTIRNAAVKPFLTCRLTFGYDTRYRKVLQLGLVINQPAYGCNLNLTNKGPAYSGEALPKALYHRYG